MAKQTKRTDGRYKASIYIGTDESGKKKYKYVYAKTQKELDKKENEIRYSLNKGVDIISGDEKFSVWAERFIKTKENTSYKNYVAIKSRTEYWKSCIGDMQISKIVTSDLQQYMNQLATKNPSTQKPSAKKTLIGYRIAVNGVFSLALKDRAITFNPADYVEIDQKAPKSERFALTDDEQQWVREMPHRAQTAAMIMLYAGLRRGEVMALRNCDVSLKAGTISVAQSVEIVKGKSVIKQGGKTDAATRTIPIPTVLKDYLKTDIDASSPFELIICRESGQVMTDMTWRRMWDSYMKDLNFKYGKFKERPKSKFDPAGIPFVIRRFTPHCLRHTYATNLFLAGIDAVTAKELLGHTDIKTTLNIYTHISEQYKNNSVSKLDEFLSKMA